MEPVRSLQQGKDGQQGPAYVGVRPNTCVLNQVGKLQSPQGPLLAFKHAGRAIAMRGTSYSLYMYVVQVSQCCLFCGDRRSGASADTVSL